MADDNSRLSHPVSERVVASGLPSVTWTVILGLASADVALTLVGIQGCLTEQNPVASWVLDSFGPLGLVALKGFALGLLAIAVQRLPSRYSGAAIGGFCLTQLFAVGWNAMLVSSQASLCGG